MATIRKVTDETMTTFDSITYNRKVNTEAMISQGYSAEHARDMAIRMFPEHSADKAITNRIRLPKKTKPAKRVQRGPRDRRTAPAVRLWAKENLPDEYIDPRGAVPKVFLAKFRELPKADQDNYRNQFNCNGKRISG